MHISPTLPDALLYTSVHSKRHGTTSSAFCLARASVQAVKYSFLLFRARHWLLWPILADSHKILYKDLTLIPFVTIFFFGFHCFTFFFFFFFLKGIFQSAVMVAFEGFLFFHTDFLWFPSLGILMSGPDSCTGEYAGSITSQRSQTTVKEEGSMKGLYTWFCSYRKSCHMNTLENFGILQSCTEPFVNPQKKCSFCFSGSPSTDSFLLISLVILIKMLDCGYADCLMWSLAIMLITVFSQFFPICFIHLWILTVI